MSRHRSIQPIAIGRCSLDAGLLVGMPLPVRFRSAWLSRLPSLRFGSPVTMYARHGRLKNQEPAGLSKQADDADRDNGEDSMDSQFGKGDGFEPSGDRSG